MAKPNLFIIGAPKAGTTSLRDYLSQHPDIFRSSPDEPHFFIKGDWGGAMDWLVKVDSLEQYEALFDGGAQHQYRCEGSTWYLASPDAPIRVKQHYPDAKILAIIRQPVERDYSDFNFSQRDGKTFVGRSFEDVFAESTGSFVAENYISFLSMYATQVKNWRRYFPAEQFRVLLLDDLITADKALIEDVFVWLGLDPNKIQLKHTASNTTNLPKYPLARRLYTSLGGPLRTLVKSVTPGALKRRIRKNIVEAGKRPDKLPMEVRLRLTERYHQQIGELEDILQRDLSHWRR